MVSLGSTRRHRGRPDRLPPRQRRRVVVAVELGRGSACASVSDAGAGRDVAPAAGCDRLWGWSVTGHSFPSQTRTKNWGWRAGSPGVAPRSAGPAPMTRTFVSPLAGRCRPRCRGGVQSTPLGCDKDGRQPTAMTTSGGWTRHLDADPSFLEARVAAPAQCLRAVVSGAARGKRYDVVAVKSDSALHGPECSQHPWHSHQGTALICSLAMRCHLDP